MKSKLFIKRSLSIKDSFKVLNKTAKKTLIVIDDFNKLLGTLSNGDLRKAILKGKKLNNKIDSIFNKKCSFFKENLIPNNKKIKNIFLSKGIDLIPVVNSKKKITRVIFPGSTLQTHKIRKKIKFNAVIMAGGKGTRLQPFTHILPKPLIPIRKKPVIEHIINKVNDFNPEKIFITVNYKSKILKAFFEELKPRLNIELIFENKALGTCGSLRKIKIKKNYPILLLNCDTLLNLNLQNVIREHINKSNDMTIVVSKKNFKMPYGVCETSSDKILKKFIEKPNYQFSINTGVYVISKKMIKLIPKNKKFDITGLIKRGKLKKDKIGVFETDLNSWQDVGNWKNYLND